MDDQLKYFSNYTSNFREILYSSPLSWLIPNLYTNRKKLQSMIYLTAGLYVIPPPPRVIIMNVFIVRMDSIFLINSTVLNAIRFVTVTNFNFLNLSRHKYMNIEYYRQLELLFFGLKTSVYMFFLCVTPNFNA